ncbi:MAG: hypothetical protein JOZ72_10115 [Alphaproteobacteria bacterium]|nr:hypothetical protein [Alphaproteobacteria bacterium]
MRLTVLVLALIATPAFADDLTAAIEVGRFGVMLDQAAAIEQVALPTAATGGDLYGQLVATVGRFNVLAGQVCRKAELPAADCAGPFEPAWLSSRGPDLNAMIDEAGGRIGTFWGDVCARAPDRHSCDIE